MDEAEANARLYLNRFTNVMAPISIQPAYGGPLYAIRNVAFNASQEQIKLKSYGGIYEPSGALILHNTFVSPTHALSIAAGITQHNSVLENNLFIGPSTLTYNRTVSWDVGVDAGRFDYNGYFPNGGFFFRSSMAWRSPLPELSCVASGGLFEQHGVLLTTPIFEKGFVGPADKRQPASPGDFRIAASSNAIDRGKPLPGINSNFMGTGPDLGALERGCPPALYGPRLPAQEQYVAAVDCRVVDGAKPTVSIASPAPNATVSGVITVRANATDNIGVARVEFFVDGALAATDNTAQIYEFLWNTAGVPNGNHTLQAKAFDEAGDFATSASVQVTVNNAVVVKEALFVVGNTTLTAPDKALSNRLTALGFTVTVASSATVTAAAAADKTLVVLSDSVAPASVNTKFKAVAKPVLVLESTLFDDMAMTGKVAGTDYGTKGTQTQVAVSGTHPLAAGLAGKVTVVTAASAFNWGKPGASAAIGARVAVGTQATSFGYEAGELDGGLRRTESKGGPVHWHHSQHQAQRERLEAVRRCCPVGRGAVARRNPRQRTGYLSRDACTETTCVQEVSRHLRSRVKSFHAFFEMSFWKPSQEIHWTGNSNGDGWTDLAAAFWCLGRAGQRLESGRARRNGTHQRCTWTCWSSIVTSFGRSIQTPWRRVRCNCE